MKKVLETKRMYLRRFSLDDAVAYAKAYSDVTVMKFIGDGTWARPAEEVHEVIAEYQKTYVSHPDLGYWAIIDRDSDQLIGDAGLSPLIQTGEIEVGYLLRKDFWGKGLATELVAALLKHAIESLGIAQVVAVIDPRNLNSIAVVKKCGMREGEPGVYHNRDSLKYLFP